LLVVWRGSAIIIWPLVSKWDEGGVSSRSSLGC
jgi:hypothetical protein